jgi:transcriptional regulator with XRE-family HTH domain
MGIKVTRLKQAIGLQICEMRSRAGLTQMQLAMKLGTSPANISFWETGRTMPDSRYLELLCDEFGVELKFIENK